jgi:WD40 repeat protein
VAMKKRSTSWPWAIRAACSRRPRLPPDATRYLYEGERFPPPLVSNILTSSQCNYQDQGAAVIVWDLANREELYRLTGFQKSVLQLAFSPDDHFLAASSEDCRILLWDMRVRLFGRLPIPCLRLSLGALLMFTLRPRSSCSPRHSRRP